MRVRPATSRVTEIHVCTCVYMSVCVCVCVCLLLDVWVPADS